MSKMLSSADISLSFLPSSQMCKLSQAGWQMVGFRHVLEFEIFFSTFDGEFIRNKRVFVQVEKGFSALSL
jgi:hypothetical protein